MTYQPVLFVLNVNQTILEDVFRDLGIFYYDHMENILSLVKSNNQITLVHFSYYFAKSINAIGLKISAIRVNMILKVFAQKN